MSENKNCKTYQISNDQRKMFTEPKLDRIEELSAQLVLANEALRRLEHERTQMFENISHDLRAPLTAVRSAIDYIMTFIEDDNNQLDENLPNNSIDLIELKRLISLMDNRTQTLEKLVQDLYYLTMLNQREKQFQFEEVLIGGFLEDYFFEASIEEKYEKRNLKLIIPKEFPYRVRMDTAKMTRVLDNLFINALKYSKEEAKIVLGTYYQNKNVVFYVEDSGIGIAPDQLDQIFVRSYVIAEARTPSSLGGSGLGLAIVKSIVKEHGGSVDCCSRLGKGSRFSVQLPVIIL